jgi:2'-5' RNA ligase
MAAALVPATGFVVAVPEAEPLVSGLRSRFAPSATEGVSAHITVLYPFMPPAQVTPDVLAHAAAAVLGLAPFDFLLARVKRFPGVLYLAPEPVAPFVALTEALVRTFPAYPPFGGVHDRIVPHLTVAQGDDDTLRRAEAELRTGLREHGPVAASCRRLCLLQNAGDRWSEWHQLALRGPGALAS